MFIVIFILLVLCVLTTTEIDLFLIEYHGKSIVDARFSWISRALREYTSTEYGRVFNDEELIACLQTKQKEYNETTRLHRTEPKYST